MIKSDTEGFVRLALGLALNVCLWPLIQAFGGWSTYEREMLLSLISASLAAAVVVAVVPLFRHGKPWQVPLAFVLLWLPALAVCSVIVTLGHQL